MKTRFQIIATLSLLFFSSQKISAQNNAKKSNDQNDPVNHGICLTESPSQQWEAELQKLIKQNQDEHAENKTQSTAYTIPVIIHVVHGGQPVGTYPNLAQGQLNSQIQVLNNDYGGIGFNSGNYPLTAFSAYAANQGLPQANLDIYGRIQIANCNIQFCLATKDSLGNVLAEPGIERINYVTRGWTNPVTFTTNNALKNYVDGVIKPQTIWNVTKYLNVWVTEIGGAASLLGYATFPPLSGLVGLSGFSGTSTTDGFWCNSRTFGSQNIFPGGTYMAGYTRGRISTHEIGHYLGLRHTWGDGTCATDYCDDTPPSFDSNSGFPIYPFNATGSNSCATAVNGSMFMNFMDYTNDQYMFTVDQATRVQTAMANSPYRKFLGQHNLCTVAGMAPVVQFKLPSTVCGASVLNPTNTSVGTPVPNFTWTASGSASITPNANLFSPKISFPSPGIYTLTLSADNGTLTTVSRTIAVHPIPTITLSSPALVCKNDNIVISASGADTYEWRPSFLTTSSISYSASTGITFTCFATDVNLCKTNAAVTITVSECLGVQGLSADLGRIAIYPNPTTENLYLTIDRELDMDFTILITDISGRVVLESNHDLVKNHKDIELPVKSLAKGLYVLKIITEVGNQIVSKFVKE